MWVDIFQGHIFIINDTGTDVKSICPKPRFNFYDSSAHLLSKIKEALRSIPFLQNLRFSDREIKSALNRAFKAMRKVTEADKSYLNQAVSVAMSIERTTDNRPVFVVDNDILAGLKSDKEKLAAVKKALVKRPVVPIHRQEIHFNRDSTREYVGSKYTSFIRQTDKSKFDDKMRLADNPEDIVFATTDYVNEGLKHPRKDNITDFARGKILIDVFGRKYSADVVIGFTKGKKCLFYDVVGFKEDNFKYKKSVSRTGSAYYSAPIELETDTINKNTPEEKSSFDSEKKCEILRGASCR